MSNINELIKNYQETGSSKKLEEILNSLVAYMMKKVQAIPFNYREDILQELKFAVFLILKSYKLSKITLPQELFIKANYNFLKKKKFNECAINKIFDNKYLNNYISEYGLTDFENAFLNNKNLDYFNIKFSSFNARNQFFSLLEKRFNSIMANFYRDNSSYLNNELFLLNRENESGDENINTISSNSKIIHRSFEEYGISLDDGKFLNLFIEGEIILSQERVAEKIGTSQQYVSKKIKKIREKYKNKVVL